MVEVSGSGYVALKNPSEHPDIFCPEVNGDCFFICSEKAGLKFKEGITLHSLKQELSIGSSVSITQIEKIIEYFNKPVQIILHKAKPDGTFPIYQRDCTTIPHGARGYIIPVHFGYLVRHFILIMNTRGLKGLTT